jgi:ATP-dependent Clp protease, protease subunit
MKEWTMKLPKKFFALAKKDSALEILVYDVIGYDFWSGGGITAGTIAAEIKQAGDFASISLRINSPGGDVFEGVAIANLLRAQNKPIAVSVDGIAASAASIIAMCGNTIAMGQGAMMMIHNAWTVAVGDAQDFLKIADTLDKISASIAETYVARTGKSLADVQALMDAETWLSADECVEEGFATSVISLPAEEDAEVMALAAVFARRFENAPKFPVPVPEEPDPDEEPDEDPDDQPEAVVDWAGLLAVRQRQLQLIS